MIKKALSLAVRIATIGLLVTIGSTGAQAATSTSFSPTTVALAQGASATITISTVGLTAGPPPDTRAFYADFTLILPAGYAVSGVACTGIFSGASPTPDPITGGAIGCAGDRRGSRDRHHGPSGQPLHPEQRVL